MEDEARNLPENEEPTQEHTEEGTPPGFISKEKWEEMGRDPADWRAPEEFKERGEKITSVLKQQRDELKAEIDAFRQDFTQYRAHQQKITEQKEKEAYDRAKREYDQQVAAIRAEKKRAVEELDGDALIRAEEAQDRLVMPQPPQHQQDTPSYAPEFVQWQSRNDWYASDQELRDYADFLSTKYVQSVQSGQLTVTQALDKVSSQVKQQFSHKFGNQARSAPAPVAESEPGRKSNGKSYRDLPGEARAACDRFVKRGIMTKEQYVKDYFGE